MGTTLWVVAASIVNLQPQLSPPPPVLAGNLGLIQGVVVTPGATPGKAQGSMTFKVGAITHKVNLVAHTAGAGQNGAAVGKLNYMVKGPNGYDKFMTMIVDQAQFVEGSEAGAGAAVISGAVTITNNAAWQSKRLTVHVIDGGSPGHGRDFISMRTAFVVQPLDALAAVPPTEVFFPAHTGNIVVKLID